MAPEDIEAHFTRSDGSYAFARWVRPIVPVVFGVEDETLAVVKGAIEAVVALADHKMAETDPELGANLMIFFFREWSELPEVPHMERLVPDLDLLLPKLKDADANQFRFFRFDREGAIRACFVFLRMDNELSNVPAETLALSQIVQSVLLWSDLAFRDQSPLARVTENNATILRPDIADLIRASYDPVLPAMASDPSHALRLAARTERFQ